MRAFVDLTKCQGYANCVIEADRIFDLDDETGKAVVVLDPVPAEALEDANRAVAACPVSAISIAE